MWKAIDMIGKRFGRLVVISRAENSKAGHPRWNCLCDCGGTTITDGQDLRNGHTKSCGCLHKERDSEVHIKHGMSETPNYGVWTDMKQRCLNPNNKHYKDYGGRGIVVCERWDKFENFYADMGNKPKGLTLERRDNNKGYFPENCFWATRKEQNRNKRSNRIIKYDGKEQCLMTWSEELGINYNTLRKRLKTYPPQFAFNM